MSELSVSTIAAGLTTRRFGRPTLYFAAVGSTNDVLRERAAAGADEGTLAIADEQTAGRGRSGRSWWAEPGSALLFSLLLRPPLVPARAAQTTMCLGLGALAGIERVTGLAAALKWPNDLVAGGRKLAGMLTEMETGPEGLKWVILGLGLNVNTDLAGAPADIAGTATSLAMLLGRPVDRLALLDAILSATEEWYERLLSGQDIHQAWAAHLDTLGRQVRVVLPGAAELAGIAESVTPAGALLVRTADGLVHTVWAGDILALRAGSA